VNDPESEPRISEADRIKVEGRAGRRQAFNDHVKKCLTCRDSKQDLCSIGEGLLHAALDEK
jgi:hypothetical protein